MSERAETTVERRKRPRIDAREGTRVLIIDDSKTIVAAVRKFLRSAGYETLEALDAEAGLELMRAHKPDLVFLDIVLPGMNGFAALRAIRRDPALRDTPVIIKSLSDIIYVANMLGGGHIEWQAQDQPGLMAEISSLREQYSHLQPAIDKLAGELRGSLQ